MTNNNNNWRPERGWLTRLADRIPRTKNGDPNFENLETVQQLFTPEQVTYLVNKALYNLTYAKDYHKNRAQIERDALAPLKKKIHELYHRSYLTATPEEIAEATKAVAADMKGEGEE